MNIQPHSQPEIAYILKGYPRISETFISNEILRLEQMGFRIQIFPMRHSRENFTHDSVKRIIAPVHYLPTEFLKDFFKLVLPNLLLFFKSPLRYREALNTAFTRFRRTKKTATFKHLLQAGYMVYNHLLKDSVVVHLHGHFAHSPTSVTMFASILSGIPYSFTAHAKDIYTSNSDQLAEKIEKAGFVATCTAYNARYLASICKNSTTPIYCNYHGIDTALFRSAGARAQCTPPFNLFTVARITAKKGLPTLYKSLAILQKRGVLFRHILIGDGNDRDATLALIEELGLSRNCTWLGTQPHEIVLQHFAKSDLFLLACEIAEDGDRDGIPNVLVESLAMGVPTISTDVSAIPELIRHLETGILVPPSQSEALADAIELLLQDTALRRRIITEGQQFVRKNFDNIQLIEELAEIFRRHIPAMTSQFREEEEA